MVETRETKKGSSGVAGVELTLSEEQIVLARTLRRSIDVKGGSRNEVRARLISACLFVVSNMTNEVLEGDGGWEEGRPTVQAYYTDLLANMLHFEDQSGVNGFEAKEMAERHFEQEVTQPTA